MIEILKRIFMETKIHYYWWMNKHYECKVSRHQYYMRKCKEYSNKGSTAETKYKKRYEKEES